MRKYRFETERLFVRDMVVDDCDLVAKIWGNVEVGKYLADPYYKNGEELRNCFKIVNLIRVKIGLMIFILFFLIRQIKKLLELPVRGRWTAMFGELAILSKKLFGARGLR